MPLAAAGAVLPAEATVVDVIAAVVEVVELVDDEVLLVETTVVVVVSAVSVLVKLTDLPTPVSVSPIATKTTAITATSEVPSPTPFRRLRMRTSFELNHTEPTGLDGSAQPQQSGEDADAHEDRQAQRHVVTHGRRHFLLVRVEPVQEVADTESHQGDEALDDLAQRHLSTADDQLRGVPAGLGRHLAELLTEFHVLLGQLATDVAVERVDLSRAKPSSDQVFTSSESVHEVLLGVEG